VQELFAPEEEGEGPVVYLPLDNDLNDASGNGLHAADSGAVATTFVDDPERGRVAFFEAAAHAALPKDDALRFGTNDFSFAMWMKIDRVGGDPAIFGNKDWDSGRNKGFVCYVKNALETGAGNFGINFSDGPEDQGGSHNRLYWEAFPNGAPDVIDGTWHSVAVSFDRDDTMRVWIDGELQYSEIDLSITPGMAHDDVNDYPIRLMEDGTGRYNGDGLAGYLDEIRVWNRPLTDEEVKELYAPEEEEGEGPVVYLPMDNDLNDASGNGLHAADSGAVATVFVDDPERGRVAFFEAAAHAALPKDDALRFGTNDFSFAMWLKIDRVGGDPAIFGNKDWDSGRNKGFVCYVKDADQMGSKNFGINFSDGPEDQGGSHNRLYWETFPNGGPDAIDGTWHFVAASFDRDDTLRVWIDGEQIYSEIDLTTTPGMAHDDVNDYPIRLMEDGTGSYNGDGLAGYMDEVRVWNRTVTNEEIVALYDETNTAVTDIAASSAEMLVYPNPANGTVNLLFNAKKAGMASVQLFNSTGMLVKEFTHSSVNGQNTVTFSVKDWRPGMYFVRVISDSAPETIRLVVE
jgi:hypothetical protein